MFLYHGSGYKNKELKPGYLHTGKFIKWDITESNEYLYATTEQNIAIILGWVGAINIKYNCKKTQTNTTEIILHFDNDVKEKDIIQLPVYVYTIKYQEHDKWIKNNNEFNSLETEYKTKSIIASDNILKIENINMRQYLKDNNIKIKIINNSKNKTIDIRTPKELMNWMDKNLTYHGVSKEYLYTADDVLKYKKAHCWESSELEYIQLTKMGYKCELLYLEDKDVNVTHTTVLYSDDNNWYWFEWAWYKYTGIHSNSAGNKKDEQINMIKNIVSKFIKDNGNCNIIRLGYVHITENMTQIEYRNSMLKMKSIDLNDKLSIENINKPIYSKW